LSVAKAENQFKRMAADAAERIDRARAAGEQLNLLPTEPDAGALVADGPRQPGQRGKGKAVSQFREWLALRGHRLPEDVLVEMAGMASGEDAFLVAMRRTEQVLAFAYGHGQARGQVRLQLFMQIYAAQLRAAEALLPYGLAKVQPDSAPPPPVQVNVFGGAAQGAPEPRDVTPKAGRIAPPPLPHEMQQKQDVSEGDAENSDAETRTEGPSR
jgi:hypothetical protein